MNRKIVLTLILVMAISTLSIISVKPVFAQISISTPYVPEFSVTYIASAYSLNSTNSYTGATITDTYINNTVQVVILNQAFNPNALENGTALSLYYTVQEKGHFSDQWTTLSSYASASSSDYTVINYGIGVENGTNSVIPSPAGGQIDFQVQAFIGYGTREPEYAYNSGIQIGWTIQYTGESSAWSNTQTIAAADGSTSTSISTNSPYPTPSSENTIAAYAGAGGSISPNGVVNVDSGGNQTFTITPDSGYQIADVKVNGNSVGTISTYTFINVLSDQNITATFTSVGNPTSTSTSTPTTPANPTATPKNPTSGISATTETGVNWTQIALFTAIAFIAALVVAVVVLARKKQAAAKT